MIVSVCTIGFGGLSSPASLPFSQEGQYGVSMEGHVHLYR